MPLFNRRRTFTQCRPTSVSFVTEVGLFLLPRLLASMLLIAFLQSPLAVLLEGRGVCHDEQRIVMTPTPYNEAVLIPSYRGTLCFHGAVIDAKRCSESNLWHHDLFPG